MKSGFLILSILLCYFQSHSQSDELRYIEDNLYVNRTRSLSIKNVETYLKEQYNELKKDEQGLVRVVVLNFENDTLTILDYDSKGIKQRQYFYSGKRGAATMRVDEWEN